MDFEDALVTYLKAQTGLTGLIDKRIYPDETPASVDLAKTSVLVYQQMQTDNIITTHDGIDNTETPNYQFTAYAPTRTAARVIAAQVKAALADYSGSMSGVNVQAITLTNELRDTVKTDTGISVSAVIQEYEITYDRS